MILVQDVHGLEPGIWQIVTYDDIGQTETDRYAQRDKVAVIIYVGIR